LDTTKDITLNSVIISLYFLLKVNYN
jgi:hypothetical protein